MIIRPKQWLRILHINAVLAKHGLDEIIFATHFFRPLRFLLYLNPSYWTRNRKQPLAVRIRLALEELGPIYVKFGQILSTRSDILPDDIAAELSKLQDQVPPFPSDISKALIEKALQQPLTAVFSEFEDTPLASASIAQVHSATMFDGRKVVVKVVRPDIEKAIVRDVGLLQYLALLAERYWKEGRRLHPIEVVEEFRKTILDELDLQREAANAAQLRRNFENSSILYVPEVVWELTRRNVLVIEKISGIPVNKVDQLVEAGVDLKDVAAKGVEIFFTQVFRDNFFHADMHPGNIFISPDGHYIAVDFGIMGSLSLQDQRYLAENFLAFFQRDYHKVAKLHVESGWVPEHTRIDEFESAIRTVCDPIFQKPLKDISFGNLLLRLFQTARRFNMEVQPQLVLLQKTLLNIEGLGKQLYPDLNLWDTAKPFLETWMKDQLGHRALWNQLKREFPKWGDRIPELPALAHDVLKQASEGKLKIEWKSAELERLRREIRASNHRTITAITGAAFVISAAVIFALDGYGKTMLGGAPLLTWLLGGLGVYLLTTAWPGNRD